MEQSQNPLLYDIAVLGANGGIGSEVVLQALDAGHKVTAIVRTPAKITIIHPHLKIVRGDVMSTGTLTEHLKNKDMVIAAIGKDSLKKTTLYSQGSKNLMTAMKDAGCNRAFFISASGIEVNPTHSLLVRIATKLILQQLLRNMYADLWRMEKIIKANNINWTIMRPPRLLNRAPSGNYRIAIDDYLPNGLKISRADVAHFIVNNLNNASIIQKTVAIAY